MLVNRDRACRYEHWADYVERLVAIEADEQAQKKGELAELSRGWPIGTTGWKRVIAQEYVQLALHPRIEHEEARLLLEALWRRQLDDALTRCGKGAADIARDRKGAAWKIDIARALRKYCQTTNVWIARELKMGYPRAVSSYMRSKAPSKI